MHNFVYDVLDALVPQLERAIRKAHKIGLKIATGADHCNEEDAINRISIEVERFVQFGMSNGKLALKRIPFAVSD